MGLDQKCWDEEQAWLVASKFGPKRADTILKNLAFEKEMARLDRMVKRGKSVQVPTYLPENIGDSRQELMVESRFGEALLGLARCYDEDLHNFFQILADAD